MYVFVIMVGLIILIRILIKRNTTSNKNDLLLTLIIGEIKNNSWHKAQKEVSDHDVDAIIVLN